MNIIEKLLGNSDLLFILGCAALWVYSIVDRICDAIEARGRK